MDERESEARAMEWVEGALQPVRQTFTRERARAFLATHGVPLLIVALAALVPQTILHLLHPGIPHSPDSTEYLATADKILNSGQIADPKRTPGYPTFLAVVFSLFPPQNLWAVITVQLGLCFAAALAVYLLAYRLTARRWVAAVAAALVGLNIYMLDWAYSIRDESFSYALTVALFLIVERLARRVTPLVVAGFVALSTLLVMTRPFYLFLPALIGVALLARAFGLRQTRRELVALGLALVMIYGLVGGYVVLNGMSNGYYGVSYVSDANLFGKALEYRMFNKPVPAQFQPIQADARQFVAAGGHLPWTFAKKYGFSENYYHPLGAYARFVILHDPVTYAIGTVKDTARVGLATPGEDASGKGWPALNLVFKLTRALGRLELYTYLALPLALIWLGWRVSRGGWRDPALLVVALLVLAAAGSIVMTAVGSYAEFYRLRAPIDWAWLAAATLLAVEAARALRRMRRPASAVDVV